ncbi:protein interacting with Hsp90 1 [Monosporozyma servazzii]
MYLTPIDKLNAVEIIPTPYLVIKSLITSPTTYQNVKIFINLCHSDKVPPPKTQFNPLTTFTEIMNNQWEIPIITSPQRWDNDKKGNKCMVYDCLINSNNINDLDTVPELKQIVIEWCIESCELSDNLIINRDTIKFPKISYKSNNNEPIPIEIKNEKVDNDSPPLDNTFTTWKNDLLYKQELAQESNSLETLFPNQQQQINNNNQSNKKPLIQELSSSQRPLKQKNVLPNKSKLNYSVTMRKTNDTTKYKLRIEIDISSDIDIKHIPQSTFQVQYEPKENNLKIFNIDTPQFKSNELIIPLPNLYPNMMEYTCQFKLFYIQDNSKLIIFI